MNKMIKRIVIFLITITIVIISMGCSSTDNEKITLVLDWTINTNHTGLYVALENGYFEDEGLDVDIQLPPETGAATYVATNKAQFGISYQEEVTFSRNQEIPIVAVATILQHNTSGFASRSEAEIKSPKDFEGKKYGGWGMDVEEATIKTIMEKDGGDFSKVEILPVGSMDFFSATESTVDFIWVFEGWDVVSAKINGIELNYIPLAAFDERLDYYTPVLISNETYLENNKKTVEKFLSAVKKGYLYCVENPKEAADILRKYAPELDEKLVFESQKFLAEYILDDEGKFGYMKLDVWEDYSKWLYENKLIDKVIDFENAFTNQYLK